MPTITFWLLNALLLVVDTTGKPSFITRYRIQVDKNNPVGCHRIQTASGFVAPVFNIQRQYLENRFSLSLLQLLDLDCSHILILEPIWPLFYKLGSTGSPDVVVCLAKIKTNCKTNCLTSAAGGKFSSKWKQVLLCQKDLSGQLKPQMSFGVCQSHVFWAFESSPSDGCSTFS